MSSTDQYIGSNLYPRVVSRVTRIWHSKLGFARRGRAAFNLARGFIYRGATHKIRPGNLSYLVSLLKSAYRVAMGRRENTITTFL